MKKFWVETFGCQMNKLDSEQFSGELTLNGYTPATSQDDADVILFNTCSVREHAEQKVYSRGGILKHRKAKEPGLVIGILGCMAQQEREKILDHLPHVDLVAGPDQYKNLPALIEEARASSEAVLATRHTAFIPKFDRLAAPRENPWQAFILAMKGCDEMCSYCVVPRTRGREISKPIPEIVEEAKVLVGNGVLEITLLGQNITAYGEKEGKELADLVEAVAAIPGLKRLRFVTSHPHHATRRLFRDLHTLPNVMPQIHMPAQSGSDRLLAMMKRTYTCAEYLDIVAMAREECPGIEIASDFIVGFPTETDEDFAKTVALVEKVRFGYSFIFQYSPRPGTTAIRDLADDVPSAVKLRRNHELLALQEKIQLEKNTDRVGATVEVLVEGRSDRNAERWVGRGPDNRIVVFEGDGDFAGKVIPVRIGRATALTLYGDRVGEPAPVHA
ncbi:MAG: tRNA (N6-isopentenyl adenosine(37)-C2)-methylthiotransferase MiaB [Planctomycetes bacterium]|nr:tRNA (N6-isopentenyl adenosine(37)-C2)-methylthiotransferase MiaB [Planctomycetota bacterium]